ncbi:MAG TPA: hypothetical protein VFM93_08145 [Candidatus Limnocylindria bacterium]|nr:hypothetical protein [Candidatus Limnocylindria bacterium]
MDASLAPVVLVPALIASLWTAIGVRQVGSRRWGVAGAAGGAAAAVLMLVAAYAPPGAFGTFGIPALSLAGGLALQVLFARPSALGTALAGAFAVLILVNPPVFPLVMPLVLALPVWVTAWVARDDQLRLALTFLASLVLVPAVVLGGYLLIRG